MTDSSDGPEEPDTRARLLAAAIETLEAEGEPAVRVRDVSRRAGVSFASLYHFFGDRTGLIEEAQAERYRTSLLETLRPLRQAIEVCTTKEEFRDVVRAGMAVIWSPTRADVRRRRIEALASMTSRPRLADLIREIQRDYNARVADTMREPQRRGWVRSDIDLAMFATWALGVTNGRLLVEIDPDHADGDAWDRIADEALRRILLGD